MYEIRDVLYQLNFIREKFKLVWWLALPCVHILVQQAVFKESLATKI